MPARVQKFGTAGVGTLALFLASAAPAQAITPTAVPAGSAVAAFYETYRTQPMWFRGGVDNPAIAQLTRHSPARAFRRVCRRSAAGSSSSSCSGAGTERERCRYGRCRTVSLNNLGAICPGRQAAYDRHDLRLSGACTAGNACRPNSPDCLGGAFARKLSRRRCQHESDLRTIAGRGVGAGPGDRQLDSGSAAAGESRPGAVASCNRPVPAGRLRDRRC